MKSIEKKNNLQILETKEMKIKITEIRTRENSTGQQKEKVYIAFYFLFFVVVFFFFFFFYYISLCY